MSKNGIPKLLCSMNFILVGGGERHEAKRVQRS